MIELEPPNTRPRDHGPMPRLTLDICLGHLGALQQAARDLSSVLFD